MKLHELIRASTVKAEAHEKLDEYFAGTRAGMFGEHGEHFLGPKLEKTDEHYQDSMGRIKDNFLIQNLLGGVIDTHINAVLGQEVDWDSTDDSTDDPLTEWYYSTFVQETLQDAGRTMLWCENERNRTSSILRLHIPSRRRDGDGNVPTAPLDESLLKGVRLTHPSPGSAGILRDADGETMGGYYLYDDEGEQKLELVALDTEFALQDWSTLEQRSMRGDTMIQIRSGADWSVIDDEAYYPLGGNLTIFELSRRLFVTPDMIAQQDGYNTQWSYLNRHASASAFLERVVLNAQPPGQWVDAQGNPVETGGKFVRDSHDVGPGTTNYIGGLQGKDGALTNASIAWREPSSSEPLLQNLAAHKDAIFTQGSQLHRLISGDATASGVSRVQAVQDFLTSLAPTETQMKYALKWVLETALRLGGYLETGKEKYKDVDITPKIVLEAIQPTPDEQRLTLELLYGGVISLDEAMTRAGVVDIDLMKEQIAANPREQVTV